MSVWTSHLSALLTYQLISTVFSFTVSSQMYKFEFNLLTFLLALIDLKPFFNYTYKIISSQLIFFNLNLSMQFKQEQVPYLHLKRCGLSVIFQSHCQIRTKVVLTNKHAIDWQVQDSSFLFQYYSRCNNVKLKKQIMFQLLNCLNGCQVQLFLYFINFNNLTNQLEIVVIDWDFRISSLFIWRKPLESDKQKCLCITTDLRIKKIYYVCRKFQQPSHPYSAHFMKNLRVSQAKRSYGSQFPVQVISFDSNVIIIYKSIKSIKMENINSLLQALAVDDLYRLILTSSLNIYSIRLMKLESISPAQVYQHLQKLQQRDKQNKSDTVTDHSLLNSDTWNNNQFKIFAWISVCYSYLKKKAFSQFEHQNYEFLELVFPLKSRLFISYNIKILSKEASIRRSKWFQEQIELLRSIMKQQTGQFRWGHISFQLFAKSNGLFLQIPQQCREQWINHLNPIVKKQSWKLAEDVLLFQMIVREGKKWASISKMFDGSRTEHMVKNRYKSIIHKNQSKTKKISEKKLSENILLFLEQKLSQMQPNHHKKKTRKVKEQIEMAQQKNIGKIQAETQQLMESIKDYQKQIRSDQFQQSMQHAVEEIKVRMSTRSIEMAEMNHSITGKSEQDIYIQSLLL